METRGRIAMSSNEAVISATGLSVRFGRVHVLDDLALEVKRGSVTALVGQNGAGKSTLLRVLVGALAPDAGCARVLGLDPARAGTKVRARVGFVPDRFDASSWMRGRDFLAFVARFHPTWSADDERRWIELVDLDVGAKVGELSKGNRTKLALVAALSHAPELLLLDEPFSGLDVSVRRSIATAILESLRDEKRTVLLVSHSIADVERVADRVAVLANGRIERWGEIEDVARARGGGVDLEATLCELAAVEGGAR
jgi:ABC-2 type transport system ATP-binding protein